MNSKGEDESREGVPLTNLDQALFDGAEATKRDLVEYLDAVRGRIIPVLEDRPLSVIRVHRGQEAFMQKNVPKYTPPWVRTVRWWAESSKGDVSYALCNDRRTLLWPWCASIGLTASRTWCSTSTRPTPTRSRWRFGPRMRFDKHWPMSASPGR